MHNLLQKHRMWECYLNYQLLASQMYTQKILPEEAKSPSCKLHLWSTGLIAGGSNLPLL